MSSAEQWAAAANAGEEEEEEWLEEPEEEHETLAQRWARAAVRPLQEAPLEAPHIYCVEA